MVDDDQGWHLLGGMLTTSVSSPSENWAESLGRKVKNVEAVGADVKIPSSRATAYVTATATATTHPADPVSSVPIVSLL